MFLNFAEEETHKVDLSSLSNKLLPGLTTLGFKDDRRHKGTPGSACLLCHSVHLPFTCGDHSELFFVLASVVTFLSSAYNVQTLQNNSVFPDLQSDEVDMLYSAYGDDTGVQCALRSEERILPSCVKFMSELGCNWLFFNVFLHSPSAYKSLSKAAEASPSVG